MKQPIADQGSYYKKIYDTASDHEMIETVELVFHALTPVKLWWLAVFSIVAISFPFSAGLTGKPTTPSRCWRVINAGTMRRITRRATGSG